MCVGEEGRGWCEFVECYKCSNGEIYWIMGKYKGSGY